MQDLLSSPPVERAAQRTPGSGRGRVLFVASEAAFFVTHRLALALAARDAGFEVHVATPHGRLQESIEQHGLTWHPISLRRMPHPLRDAISFFGLLRLYRAVRPDLVHHIALKAVLVGTAAARAARIPTVVNAVTGLGYAFDERRATRLVGRTVSAACDLMLGHPRTRYIYQNIEDRDLFHRRGWSTLEQSVIIRGAGVDPALFFPPSTPRPAPPMVVLVSRLLTSKGVGEFVEAARAVRARGLDARFVLVGEPDSDSADSVTGADLARWTSDGAIEAWGYRNDVASILRDASLFVLPTYYREGVPKSLIEAAASGLASVATDAPGCRDIVAHGQTGLLVPSRDVDQLVNAIDTLLRDREQREAMGRRARKWFLAHFTLDRVVAETLRTYDELLTSRES